MEAFPPKLRIPSLGLNGAVASSRVHRAELLFLRNILPTGSAWSKDQLLSWKVTSGHTCHLSTAWHCLGARQSGLAAGDPTGPILLWRAESREPSERANSPEVQPSQLEAAVCRAGQRGANALYPLISVLVLSSSPGLSSTVAGSLWPTPRAGSPPAVSSAACPRRQRRPFAHQGVPSGP